MKRRILIIAGAIFVTGGIYLGLRIFSAQPQAPVVIAATGLSGSALIEWVPSESATGYSIYWSNGKNVPISDASKKSGIKSPYLLNGLENDSPCYITVTSYNTFSESAPSVTVCVVPSNSTVPKILSANTDDGRAIIGWNQIRNATGYNVYFSETSPVDPSKAKKISDAVSPLVLSGLINGKTYYVAVSSIVDGKESEPSLEIKTVPTKRPDAITASNDWWRKNTVFEHIWVTAFQDGSRPGVEAKDSTGNLAGITKAITSGYFNRLGVNALWLSPIFEAPSLRGGSGSKHGYDIADYMNVSSVLGSKQDLVALLSAAHARGIKVIFDFVPNHTSDQNPWFINSSASTDSPYRDWYVWRPANPEPQYPGPTYNGTGWQGGEGVWQYYGIFDKSMPDINYYNRDANAAMKNIVKNWMDFGFDGMRVDAVRYLYEGSTKESYQDLAATHLWYDTVRSSVIDGFADGNSKMMMAEEWVTDMPTILSYVKNKQSGAGEFNVVLDFIAPKILVSAITSSASSPSNSVSELARHLVVNSMLVRSSGGTFGFFQNNHDLIASRPVTSYNGNGVQLYLAAALNFLGQGMPILYYGNEIAMAASNNDGKVQDINMRLPFDWEAEAKLESSHDSIWKWHQALIKLRTGYHAWNDPSITQIAASDSGIFAYLISSADGTKKAVVAANLNASGNSTFTLPVKGSTATGMLGKTKDDHLKRGTLGISALPAYGIRVYAIDDSSAKTFFDHDPTPVNYNPSPKIDLPSALYLRGTVTSAQWNPVDRVNKMKQNGSIYSFTADLNGDSEYEFKFADATWGLYVYGPGTVTLDSEQSTAKGTHDVVGESYYANLAFTPEASGRYTFYLKFDPLKPTYWIK